MSEENRIRGPRFIRSVATPGGRVEKCRETSAFTLVEVMTALAILTFIALMVCATFAGVSRAWRRGMQLTEDLHHGDFVMDQLVLALRSTYYGNAPGLWPAYGFHLEDNGSGESARDSISWVKLGAAFSTANSQAVAGPHRIKFSIEDGEDGKPAAAVRFWRPDLMLEDFDPETVPATFISSRVAGFNCRITTNVSDSAWDWEDTWEEENTNRLPRAVELTLYLTPLADGGAPVEIRRCVEIPVARLSGAAGAVMSGPLKSLPPLPGVVPGAGGPVSTPPKVAPITIPPMTRRQ